MIGETLGSYRILSTIGKGGMGVVYLAEHTLIGRQAAVKLLLPEMSRDAELVERFFNEAKAAAAARHQGLVEVFDFGHADDGSAYIVMELLQGESLAARLEREKRFSPELALSVTRQVASALAAAHEQGVVHRDLKPENIYLIPDDSAPAAVRIKVLDFGIAKLARDEERRSVKTRTGVVIGTPRYMSPEQCKSASNVDARTDIYALGCIFYEMLVGTPPFDYDNWGELVAAHIHEAPPRPRQHVPETAPEIEDIVMRALAKDPAERFQSMLRLAQAIDALWPGANSMTFTPIPGSLKTIGDATAMTSPTMRTVRPQSRWWILTIAGIAALGILAAVVITQRETEQPKQIATVPIDAPVAMAPDAMVLDAAEPAVAIDAAPRAKIQLVVKSIPTGARVENLDGVIVGFTPYTRELDPIEGELRYVVKLAGFKEAPVMFDTSEAGEQVVKLQRVKVGTTKRGAGSGTSGPTVLDPYSGRK